jgi:low affinity Fe/Cu permease
MRKAFNELARHVSDAAGHYLTFLAALLIVLVWAITGPLFGFSDTWQLVINTGTTIITFLMVFLIQNTQNRDSKAIHLKLDELINAVQAADDALIPAEDATEEELVERKARYELLAKQAAAASEEMADRTVARQHGTAARR